MKNLTLGIRNILRNSRRTSLTLLAIISGVTGIVVCGGFIEFAFEGLRESTIRTQLGHVQIARQGFDEHGLADPGEYLIEDPSSIEDELRALPGIAAITRRLGFAGLISNGSQTVTAKVIGVLPEREEGFSAFETVLSGQQLDQTMLDGGVIGYGLAVALGANIDDYLTILTTTYDGVINAVEFKVVGIAQTGSADYDAVFVKLPLPLVQRALNTSSVEKILVLLKQSSQLPQFIKGLKKSIIQHQPLEFKSWEQLAGYYHRVVDLYRGMFGVIKVIICVIVLFSIVNTMTMSVFERTREIGTLRAIGIDRIGVMGLFITEGLLLGILGGVLGLVTGIVAATAINIMGGIPIPAPPGMSRGYISFILIVPEILLQSFVMTVAVAVFSTIWPAWKASRMGIVEALAHS